MRELRGRAAIVTGASRGIGVAIARALAAEGMDLVLAARAREPLEALAGELAASGVRARAVPTDVADRAALAALVRAAEAAFTEIDVLVNNAGLDLMRAYERLDVATIKQVNQVNLVAPIVLTRLVLPGMVARGRGHIVNIASLAAKAGPPCGESYGATKAGLISFTKALRAEYRGTGVSASAIVPGYIEDTGMYHRIAREAGVAAPRMLGTTTTEAVTRAIVRAIQRDLPEVIVNPGPVRPLLALNELSPRFAEWFLRRSGADALWEKAAEYFQRHGGAPGDARPPAARP